MMNRHSGEGRQGRRRGRGRRWGLGFLVALTIAGLVWGCGSWGDRPGSGDQTTTADRPGDRTEIVFWTMQLQPKFTDYFNQLIADFERQEPKLHVRWLDIPWAAMESKILTAVAARTAPDVANLNPSFASRLAARGAWLDLESRLSPAARSIYLPKIWQASHVNGETFGLPWYLTTRVTIYNRALLAQAGLTEPPKTYAELAIAARQIREKTGKYAFFVTFLANDSGEILESLVQMGVTLVDDRGRAAFDTPAGRAAFAYWTNLYRQGLIPREGLTQGHRKAIELYQAGETALLGTGAEFLASIATNAPSIAHQSGAAPQITGATGKQAVAVMNLTIPKKSRHADAALRFAQFVTNSANQLQFAQAANVLPSTEQALKDYRNQLGQPRSTPAAVPTPSTAVSPGLDPVIGATIEQARQISADQLDRAEVLLPAVKDIKDLQAIVYENLQAALLGEKTVDRAVSDAATAWNALHG